MINRHRRPRIPAQKKYIDNTFHRFHSTKLRCVSHINIFLPSHKIHTLILHKSPFLSFVIPSSDHSTAIRDYCHPHNSPCLHSPVSNCLTFLQSASTSKPAPFPGLFFSCSAFSHLPRPNPSPFAHQTSEINLGLHAQAITDGCPAPRVTPGGICAGP